MMWYDGAKPCGWWEGWGSFRESGGRFLSEVASELTLEV